MNNIVYKTALDIGSSKIKAIMGELSENGQKIKILGSVDVPSTGMRKAKVSNAEVLTSEIVVTLKKLEALTGQKITKVSIGIGGDLIKSKTKNSHHSFGEDSIAVTEEHFELLFKDAEEKLGHEETVIKKELYNLRVNGSGIIKDPLGIKAKELSGDIHTISCEKAHIDSIVEVVNRAGYEVEMITLNIFASAEAILSNEDKKMGVALVDIGEGSTDLIIFKSGKMIYAKSIAVGGMHFISDIAYTLKISTEHAKKIISEYEKTNSESIQIEIDNKSFEYKTSVIKDLLEARGEDIIKSLSKSVQESGFNGYLGNGMLLTGGATRIKGLEEQIAKSLNHKVRVGKLSEIRGFSNQNPAYATSLGILLEIMQKEHKRIEMKVEAVKAEQEKAKVKEEVKVKIEKAKEEIKVPEQKPKRQKKPSQIQEKFKGIRKLMKELF